MNISCRPLVRLLFEIFEALMHRREKRKRQAPTLSVGARAAANGNSKRGGEKPFFCFRPGHKVQGLIVGCWGWMKMLSDALSHKHYTRPCRKGITVSMPTRRAELWLNNNVATQIESSKMDPHATLVAFARFAAATRWLLCKAISSPSVNGAGSLTQ